MKYRLTSLQTLFAQSETKESGLGTWNLCNGFLLRGKCDFERLDRAVHTLYKKHDAMRMTLNTDENGFYFEINDEVPYGLEIIELKSEGRDERLKEAYADVAERVNFPFSADKKSMYRYWIYKITDDENLLCYVANHVATDGCSMAVLNDELAKLYEDPDRTDIEESASFAEFILEREKLYKEKFTDEESKYWLDRMVGYKEPVAEMPVEIQKVSSKIFGVFKIDLEKMNNISRRNKTSNFNVLFSMMQLAVAELTGQNDVALCYTFANRFKRQFRNTIGCLTHCITMRHKFSLNEHWSEISAVRRDTMNKDMKHLAFGDSIEAEYLLSYIPNYGSNETVEKFGGLDSEPLVFNSNSNIGKRFFALVAVEHGTDIYVTPYCDNNIYSKEFVLNFGKTINKYADILTESEDPTVSELFGKS